MRQRIPQLSISSKMTIAIVFMGIGAGLWHWFMDRISDYQDMSTYLLGVLGAISLLIACWIIQACLTANQRSNHKPENKENNQ